MKKSFDSKLYEQLQTKRILDRVNQFSGKLYLEFGGKLFDDLHASRVLPGFLPDAKVRILQKLSNKVEIIMVVSSADIERKKVRADYGITYDNEVLRQIGRLRKMGLYVSSIVLTMYDGQKSADKFIKKLKSMGENVYIHRKTLGYPDNTSLIVSEKGYGANPYIRTTKPLIVVTAPGPGSGKMGTCLSQLYHESKQGIKSGYAKFETFPIWNLPVDHPVNLAYEAATADLKDKNMVDIHHLKAYGEKVTNYNRDIESFPILKDILTKITKNPDLYKSPTDMGVNMAGYAIVDDEGVCEASKKEIIRRYYKALCEAKQGNDSGEMAEVILNIIKEYKIDIRIRKVIESAKEKFVKKGTPSVAIKLENAKIICGRETELLSACSSAVLNCLKELANIPDEIDLLDEKVLKPICSLKRNLSGDDSQKLNLYDVLVALAICSTTDKTAQKAYEQLNKLYGCDAHSSHMVFGADISTMKRLKIDISAEPEWNI